MRKHIVLVLLASVLVGCAPNYQTRIVSEPDDAKIYVDGEFQGKGVTSIDVGPEHNYPKSYDVIIKHDGFKTLTTTIKNEPDYAFAGTQFGLLFGLSLLNLAIFAGNPNQFTSNGIIGGACLLVTPLAFFNSNKFHKAYDFELDKEATSDAK